MPAMAEIEQESVRQYWENVTPSILGPYMMDGFGFPVGVGNFRFRAESKIVKRLLRGVDASGSVLDLGSGVGFWAEEFAHYFSRVTAVEGSSTLYKELQARCAPYTSIKSIHGDVLSFEPEGRYHLIFLGGLLMYLDQKDVTILLKKLTPYLDEGGIILCRESTVRGKAVMHQSANYPVIYRSVSDYHELFRQCGLVIRQVERNKPYVLMQMGCELIKKWKGKMREPFHVLPVVGRLVYWVLRLGNPWINHLPKVLGISFPKLENHFFVLEANSSVSDKK